MLIKLTISGIKQHKTLLDEELRVVRLIQDDLNQQISMGADPGSLTLIRQRKWVEKELQCIVRRMKLLDYITDTMRSANVETEQELKAVIRTLKSNNP